MGKGSKRQRKAARSSVKSHTKDDAFREDDMDDEIDAFHKQRDVIPLDVNDEGDSEDEDLEEPVFDFEGGVDDDSDDVKSDDDDDEDDDDVRPKGFAAKIARQAKYLQQKFGGGEDEMDDQEEEEEEKKAVWGRKKNLYYNADNVDYELQSSDEDFPMEEEAEVLKIQREKAKSLSMEDFGIEEADHDESDSDKWDKTIQEALDGKKIMGKVDVDGAFEDNPFENYEKIKKDLSALSKEEQMDVVYSSAPELVGLLSELNEAFDQLQKVKPVLFKVRERKDTADGIMHYLEVKQILLLTYCQAISFYLLLKSEGHPVRDHPVIGRLVEIKNLVEKVKQIDANLPSQIEDIVNHNSANGSSNGLVGESVPLEPEPQTAGQSAKPYEAALVNETTELAKVDSKDNHNGSADQKQQDARVGLQSLEMLKVRANLEEKLKQKGIYNFTRSKSEKMQNHTLKPVNRSLGAANDFDDEVQQNAIGHHMNNGRASLLKTDKLSQLVATKVNRSKVTSGDDDLPKRDDIGERRRKHELHVLARAGANPMDDDDMAVEDGSLDRNPMNIDASEDGEAIGSEDEFYKEVKKQRAEKLKAKAELYSRTPAILSSVEPEADGKRQITYQMEKNRGLTRPRKKLTKIPRKKYKIKHQKAVIRRKGQVREVRKPTGPYGGESTGINTSVSRSIRFKS
ncbi:something about silencing protein 10 [Phoenix dactylifera]|uniref:Something about silencing protein 10 n=1 Tax=Phoenix dactylifera TaxID=42345 RepID=A0A8B7C3J1_PHODC|nr:something about silencing protein 10 [Phoenix dactylifera]